MKSSVGKQIAVGALIAVHLGASLLLPNSHQHTVCGSQGQRTIQSHDCGSNEIHKPLDEVKRCLLCLRASNFIAVVQLFSSVPKTVVHPLEQYDLHPQSTDGVQYSELDRGPPSIFS